jgi:hypothetical protein
MCAAYNYTILTVSQFAWRCRLHGVTPIRNIDLEQATRLQARLNVAAEGRRHTTPRWSRTAALLGARWNKGRASLTPIGRKPKDRREAETKLRQAAR